MLSTRAGALQNNAVLSPRHKIVWLRHRDFLKIGSLATLLLLLLLWQWELVVAEKGFLSALLLHLTQHFYFILPFIADIEVSS